MSLGSWDPGADSDALTIQIEPATLDRFISYSRDDQLAQLEQLIEGEQCQRLAGLMRIDHSTWRTAVEERSDDELLHLIRFFAVAENLPGWEAGPASPVIALAKTLRQRGTRLEKALLRWLREVSENRFLPYGPL